MFVANTRSDRPQRVTRNRGSKPDQACQCNPCARPRARQTWSYPTLVRVASPVFSDQFGSWLIHASNQNLGLLWRTCVCAETRGRDGRCDEHGCPARKARVGEMGDAVQRGCVDRRTRRGHNGPPPGLGRDARHGGCGRLGLGGELGCRRVQVR